MSELHTEDRDTVVVNAFHGHVMVEIFDTNDDGPARTSLYLTKDEARLLAIDLLVTGVQA